MPQLDFFTIQSQIFCLILSLFLIYIFLLKYAMPTYDVYLRLKIKKLVHYRTQHNILIILVFTFKERVTSFAFLVTNIISSFLKVYFNFIITLIPLLYYIHINKKNVSNENLKPLNHAITNSIRVIEKEQYFLKRKVLQRVKLISLIKGF